MRAYLCHLLQILTFSAIRTSGTPVYSFQGLVYTNGSEPLVTSNISDSETVQNLTDILHLFSLKVSEDLETSGKEAIQVQSYSFQFWMTLDSTQRVSVVYPSELRDNLIQTEYERPSIETSEWAVYWDDKQRDWYYYDKIRGEHNTLVLTQIMCLYPGQA